ncbi:MAG: SAM-dependent DNA methyltransferase [Gammaproteobacteria bacterium]|nr:SAM-dependent DNA methyltransferase [Gammaproteobacteria bacterium]
MNLQDLQKSLWSAADKLRSNMDAAEYKHIVLGLVFLKYISDSFQARRDTLAARFADPDDDYYLADKDQREEEQEERDYYLETNVFWVPAEARWETLRSQAKQANFGKIIDDALLAIERENPKLKGILDKRFGRSQLPEGRLGELTDLISRIGFESGGKARDVLGQVYEYFLGQFAAAEGKKGGQFYTPASVVRVLADILAPHKGKVYDPCCGSGGMFVQSEKFVESHGGRHGDISIYGQESNPTTWRLAAMNLAVRHIEFNLGKEPADSFGRDRHPDLRADFVLANPPFNMSDWGGDLLADDPRWMYGTPPKNNANYAWLQHMLYHLKPNGVAGVVLANGSMSSNTSNEGNIRRAMIEAEVVDCMVALPPQLFLNTQIPACLWILHKGRRKRRGEVLFIDARKLGQLETRAWRIFSSEDIARIADIYHAWRGDGETEAAYEDMPGFCKSASRKEIEKHGFVLTPGRYVGAAAVEDDGEPFTEKMERLTAELAGQFTEGAKLEVEIRKNLTRLGFPVTEA